jgi:hypothetical protein
MGAPLLIKNRDQRISNDHWTVAVPCVEVLLDQDDELTTNHHNA